MLELRARLTSVPCWLDNTALLHEPARPVALEKWLTQNQRPNAPGRQCGDHFAIAVLSHISARCTRAQALRRSPIRAGFVYLSPQSTRRRSAASFIATPLIVARPG